MVRSLKPKLVEGKACACGCANILLTLYGEIVSFVSIVFDRPVARNAT